MTSGQESGLWYVSALACTGSGEHFGKLSLLEKKQNATYIYHYLIKSGWSENAVCGLLGNIYSETGMNPGVWQKWQDTNLGYGLVQWSPCQDYLIFLRKRQEMMEKGVMEADEMAAKNPLFLLNSQLEFLDGNLTGKEEMKSENYGWIRKEAYGRMTAEEFRISDHEIGELALAFEACYERSSHGREERTRNAYVWGIYFGVIDDVTAEEEFRRRFGKSLEADSWWNEQ